MKKLLLFTLCIVSTAACHGMQITAVNGYQLRLDQLTRAPYALTFNLIDPDQRLHVNNETIAHEEAAIYTALNTMITICQNRLVHLEAIYNDTKGLDQEDIYSALQSAFLDEMKLHKRILHDLTENPNLSLLHDRAKLVAIFTTALNLFEKADQLRIRVCRHWALVNHQIQFERYTLTNESIQRNFQGYADVRLTNGNAFRQEESPFVLTPDTAHFDVAPWFERMRAFEHANLL